MTSDNSAETAVDLAGFDKLVKQREQGAEVQLKDPRNRKKLLGAAITIHGPDSKRYQDAWRRLMDERMEREKLRESTDEERQTDNCLLYARLIVSWRGVVVDGKALPFTVDNAVSLFKRFPFILEDVVEFVGRRENFFGA